MRKEILTDLGYDRYFVHVDSRQPRELWETLPLIRDPRVYTIALYLNDPYLASYRAWKRVDSQSLRQELCYELFLCHSRTHSTEMSKERNAVAVKILAVVSDRVQFALYTSRALNISSTPSLYKSCILDAALKLYDSANRCIAAIPAV